MQRREPCRHALERRPHLDHLDDLALGLAHDEDAAPWERTHEALLLEDRERFADRCAADTECLHQLALIESQRLALAVDIGAGDRILEERIRLIAQAHRVDRRECELTGGDADALFRRETHWNSHAPSRPYPETWPASLRKIRFVPRQIYQISYISATPEFKVFCTKSRFLLPEGVVMFLSSPQSGHRTRFDKSEIYHIWSASDHPGMKRLHLITIH